jgi:hypothetical protein
MRPTSFPGSQATTSRYRADHESTEPLVGRLGARRGRTARASRISRYAAKSGCAGEWGGWGQVSEDGPGHYNPDRSEDPWGKAARPLVRWCTSAPRSSTQSEDAALQAAGCTKDGCKLYAARNSRWQEGPSDIPALKPYWGKPTVRNFREDHGNVGIIRSPVRAMVLPGGHEDQLRNRLLLWCRRRQPSGRQYPAATVIARSCRSRRSR